MYQNNLIYIYLDIEILLKTSIAIIIYTTIVHDNHGYQNPDCILYSKCINDHAIIIHNLKYS